MPFIGDPQIRWGLIALMMMLLLACLALVVVVSNVEDTVNSNRQTSCVATLNNPASTARTDQRFLDLCAEVGITP